MARFKNCFKRVFQKFWKTGCTLELTGNFKMCQLYTFYYHPYIFAFKCGSKYRL